MDILAAMQRRVSVRSYDAGCPAEPALLDRLMTRAGAVEHVTGAPVRIALIDGLERARRVLTTIVGSYGLVQNPPHLLVGVLPEESDLARLDLGYALERVVLEATRLGLGTCWIAGSYSPERAGDAVSLAAGEIAAAVIALGYPVERGWGRFHSRAVRQLVRGHKRKPLAEIVFAGRWGKPWSPDGADPVLVAALEYARLAPSAINRQPWRFIVRSGDVVLATVRPAPIDAGIVMAHFALASAALGRPGRWAVRLGDAALAQECDLPPDAISVATFG
jgi:nitroreductase